MLIMNSRSHGRLISLCDPLCHPSCRGQHAKIVHALCCMLNSFTDNLNRGLVLDTTAGQLLLTARGNNTPLRCVACGVSAFLSRDD